MLIMMPFLWLANCWRRSKHAVFVALWRALFGGIWLPLVLQTKRQNWQK